MRKLLLLLTLAILVTSCEHKELCMNHPHTTPVRVDVDWSKFEPYEKPTGMTVTFFSELGREPIVRHSNITTHTLLELEADRYHILVFNQSPSEFGTFRFNNMDDPERASVSTVTSQSRWYIPRGDSECVAVDPEWLGVGNHSGAEVTEDMVNNYAQAAIKSYAEQHANNNVLATVTPRNVIYTVSVEVHIQGFHNLRSARASLTGMTEGYLLTQDKRMNSTATHLMEDWSSTRDKADATKGYITGEFTCFGLPDNHSQAPQENIFTLDLLLVDNTTIKTYVFHVGDKFVQESNGDMDGEVHLHLSLILTHDVNGNPIILPDVEPADGSDSGFDATVESWGEDIEQDIIM